MNSEETQSEQPTVPQYEFDPNKAEPIAHMWIDRGAKLTCEGAGHPYHEAWKRKAVL